MKKTYALHFEGQVEIEAENDIEATDCLMNMMVPENVSYYTIAETDPNTTAVLRWIEVHP